MTPSRRKQVARVRPRSEVVAAVAVGVGIVGGTILLIWLMRPKGTAATPGTGGLFTRQPRVVLLVLLGVIVLLSLGAWLVRGRRRPRKLRTRTALTTATIVVVAATVVGGIFWPGGLIRHWPPQPKPVTSDTTPVTDPPTAPLPTVTAKGSSGSTTPPTTTGTKPPSTPGK